MLRSFAQSLKLLAILVCVWGCAWGSAWGADTGPKALIYDGDRLEAEVLDYGPEIGNGKFGTVHKSTIRLSNGKTETMALKIFNIAITPDKVAKLARNDSLLTPVFARDQGEVLNHGRTGLRLVSTGTSSQAPAELVTLSTLADGSVSSNRASLALEPRHPSFERRLSTLVKFKRQVLSGISLLSANGLSHADIKPENILYTTKPGFDWNTPDPKKIQFSLTDFDSMSSIGKRAIFFTPAFAPPEVVLQKTISVSPSWDIFSHASSAYNLAFGKLPFPDYFYSRQPHERVYQDIEKEAYRVYVDSKSYDSFLMFVDHRFKELEKSAPTQASIPMLKELRSFVLNGLKHSPEDRLRAFPNILNGASKYFKASGKSQEECESILLYLKTHLL